MPKTPAVKRVLAPRFSVRYCDEVVAFMGEGYSLTAFAGEIGVSRATLDKWVSDKPTFAAAVERAQAARARQLESEVFKSKGSSGAHLQALKTAAPDEWPEPRARGAVQGRGKPPPRPAVALPDNGRE